VEVPFVTESFKLQDIIERVIRLNSPMINRLHIEIIRDFEDLPIVNLSKTKLIYVLSSVIENSIEALSENNSEKRVIDCQLKQSSGTAVLSICDNGSGIEEENLKSIFFFGYSTKPESDGFGLHCAANFIGEMGGSIQAESEGLGKGATVTIQLPL
jgi:sensor histidine kinase regulating citrate/malate metabolism